MPKRTVVLLAALSICLIAWVLYVSGLFLGQKTLISTGLSDSESSKDIAAVDSTQELELLKPATPTASPIVVSDVPRRVVWQDGFDTPVSGWRTFQSPQDANGKVSLIQYIESTYEISADSHNEAVAWGTQPNYPLPNYPYAVDLNLSATREAFGFVMLDYHGDPLNISNSTGLYITYELGKNTFDAEFLRPAWQANWEFAKQSEPFLVYESVRGLNWKLPCIGQKNLKLTRNSGVSVIVNERNVIVTTRDSASHRQASMVCTRVPNRPILQNGAIGLGMVSRPRFVPVAVQNSLRFADISVSAIDTFPDIPTVDGAPVLIPAGCTDDSGERSDMKAILFEAAQYEPFACVGADIPSTRFTVTRYPGTINDLLGNWQCGADSENRMLLQWNGTHVQVVYADGELFQLVAIEEQLHTQEVPSFFLIPFPSAQLRKALQPGDRLTDEYPLQLILDSNSFISNWAGECTKIP